MSLNPPQLIPAEGDRPTARSSVSESTVNGTREHDLEGQAPVEQSRNQSINNGDNEKKPRTATDLEKPFDPENPLQWPFARKLYQTVTPGQSCPNYMGEIRGYSC
jgi:hypothetical protein